MKIKYIYSTFTIPCEKSKMVSFACSMTNRFVAPSSRFRFPVKLICCIAFGSASSASCLPLSFYSLLD